VAHTLTPNAPRQETQGIWIFFLCRLPHLSTNKFGLSRKPVPATLPIQRRRFSPTPPKLNAPIQWIASTWLPHGLPPQIRR
jgi:hypothetical protein